MTYVAFNSSATPSISPLRKAFMIWQSIWERNNVLDTKPLHRRLGVRLAKAVATLAYVVSEAQAKRNVHQPTESERSNTDSSTAFSSQKRYQSFGFSSKTAVVVPCLATSNLDIAKLKGTLDCLQKQSLKPQFVFVVDDGSPLPLANHFTDAPYKIVTFIRHESNGGPAAARNTGLKAARASGVEYICFTDSDCLPESTWVENIVYYFEHNPKDDIVSGMTWSKNQHSYIETFHDVFGNLNGPQLPDRTLLYGPTCNLGIRLKTVFVEFDANFPEASFEDVDFCMKARQAGAVLRFVPSAVVLHDYDSSLRGIARQFARYGRGAAIMNRMHPNFSALYSASQYTPCSKPYITKL